MAPLYVPAGTLTLPMTSARLSSCTRFTVGTVVGAVHTVTALPPPCGMSATLNNFTPMHAQSSEGASLTIKGMVAIEVGGVPPEVPEVPEVLEALLLPPPPHAARLAARAAITAVPIACRNIMRCMFCPSVGATAPLRRPRCVQRANLQLVDLRNREIHALSRATDMTLQGELPRLKNPPM